MKTLAQRLLFLPAVLSIVLAPAIVKAVTVTLTPSVISNSYSGTIKLQIASLTTGDTVVVRKFLNINTNSAVDAADLLVQQFQLTDGQANVFTNGTTSVTNFNVPGDIDGAANGSITATLYPSMDFAQEVVGKYFFVVSSPVGHFAAITNSFSVTNFPFGQSVTGLVLNGASPVSNAVVLLFQPSNGGENPVGGTVANRAGFFSISAPAGTYQLAAFSSNFVADLSASPYVTLSAGKVISTNVPLINATQSISGRIVDATNSNLGIPGLLVPVQSTSGQYLAVAFADTNGNFLANVTADHWKVQPSSQAVPLHGYIKSGSSTKVDTTTGNVTGVSIALPKATAIFYGSVSDNLGHPLPGIDVEGDDNVSNGGLFQYSNDGYAYTNGNYTVGALAGDGWEVSVNSQDQNGVYTNYIFTQSASQQNGGDIFGNRQAVQESFIGILATNYITGNVQFNGAPVAGAGVNASATIGGVTYQSHADTDANGNYSVNVANGNWSVNLNCGGGNDGLDNILGAGTYQCPNSDNVTINNNNGIGNFVIPAANEGQIFGYLYDDFGNPVPGVTIYATDGMGDNYTTTTTGTGYYSMVAVNGAYTVSADCGQLTALGFYCVDDNVAIVSGLPTEADFTTTPVSAPVFGFATLYGFSTTATAPNLLYTNRDGSSPGGGLVLAGGNLFGTAQIGGTNGAGTVWAVNTNLLNFTLVRVFSKAATNRFGFYTNADGGVPSGGLVLVSNILYGTTAAGGANGNGTVFAVNTNGTGYRVIHTFTAGATNGFFLHTNSDGSNPDATPVQFGNTLYSTTVYGGTNGYGTVFALTTNGTLTVVHTFTALDANTQTTNTDGANPFAGLLLANGRLYGTAYAGGFFGYGTVFSVSTNGSGFTTLYNFTGGNDGANPRAGLVLSSNALFGVTSAGGQWGSGTLFVINTNGTGFTMLHAFTGEGGGYPYGTMILSNNTLYGTTSQGGSYNNGTVFSVSRGGTNFIVLHAFTGDDDGAFPLGNVILSGTTLYGTTASGGISGDGTVFAVSAGAQAVIASSSSANKQFQMLVTGTVGQPYTVQASTNLTSANWTSVLVTNLSGGTFLFNDPNATNQQRFYRILGP